MIDLDFPDERRQDIIKYLQSQYGQEHVAGIGTIQRIGTKQAVLDSAKWYEVDLQETRAFNELIVDEDTTESLKESNEPLMQDYNRKYPEVLELAGKWSGIARQFSQHPAGVIISPKSLYDIIPLRVKDGIQTTQFDMHATEEMGFLKVDILGLRNLTTLTYMAKMINMPLGDFYKLSDTSDGMDKAFDMLCAGDTIGVFQVESRGMTSVVKRLKPRTSQDISAVVALFRPGITDAGMLDIYLKRRNGEVEVEYPHPVMEEVLSDTYGIMVYQEQVMEICQKMAGYSLVEADNVRSIIGKKKIDKLPAEREKFINGCKKNNIDESISTAVFKNIEAFGRYSFNKAHSFSYGLITMWCAWAKANYPAEYMCACLNTDKPEKQQGYLTWCNMNNIDILPPNVNISKQKFTVDSGSIVFGLRGAKFLGTIAADEIISNAPYVSFEDFCERTSTKVNKKHIEQLIKCGAFDWCGERNYLLTKMSTSKIKKGIRVFDESIANVAPMTKYEKSEHEEEILGYSISGNNFNLKLPIIASLQPISDELDAESIAYIKIVNVKTRDTKSGQMAFIDFITHTYEEKSMSVSPWEWPKWKDILYEKVFGIAKIKTNMYNNSIRYELLNFIVQLDKE